MFFSDLRMRISASIVLAETEIDERKLFEALFLFTLRAFNSSAFWVI